ncbi:AbiV family abortive infection protein [Chloroflexota bacterium]
MNSNSEKEEFNESYLINNYEEVINALKSNDKVSIIDSLTKLRNSLPEQTVLSSATLEAKSSLERFKKHTELLLSCISESQFFRKGVTPEEATKDAYALYLHSIDIWRVAVNMFHNKFYPLATFLAIVSLEESAKVIVLCFEILSGHKTEKLSGKQRKNPLFSHPSKHLLAGMSGLLVNARADSILGLQCVLDFLDLIEKGRLESLRQSCLYADIQGDKLLLPQSLHDADSSSRYIAIAGEVIGESFFTQLDSPFMKELQTFEDDFLNGK